MKVVSCRKILWNALENDKNTVEVLCSNHLKYVIELCSSDSNDLSDTRTSLLLWKLKKTRDLYKELYSGLYSPKGLHMLFYSVVTDRKCVYKV